VDARHVLDLERDHPVTDADVEAQRGLREHLPTWLDLDWRALDQFDTSAALDTRPIANDAWRPFHLD
jgi:hypothetical protein